MTPSQRTDWCLAASSLLVALWAIYAAISLDSPLLFFSAAPFVLNACLYGHRAWKGEQ